MKANLPAFQVLAGQLAIAIQNAALFSQAEESRFVVEEQSRRLTRSGWQQFLNAVDRSESIGYVFSQDEVIPLVEHKILNLTIYLQSQLKLQEPMLVKSKWLKSIK